MHLCLKTIHGNSGSCFSVREPFTQNLKFKSELSFARPGSVSIWRFPKIRGTILGVPIIRTIVYWGLYWGALVLGSYHIHPSVLVLQVSKGKALPKAGQIEASLGLELWELKSGEKPHQSF